MGGENVVRIAQICVSDLTIIMLLTLFAPPPIAQQSAPGALLLLLSGANATIGPAIGSVVARLSIRPAVDANLRAGPHDGN